MADYILGLVDIIHATIVAPARDNVDGAEEMRTEPLDGFWLPRSIRRATVLAMPALKLEPRTAARRLPSETLDLYTSFHHDSADQGNLQRHAKQILGDLIPYAAALVREFARAHNQDVLLEACGALCSLNALQRWLHVYNHTTRIHYPRFLTEFSNYSYPFYRFIYLRLFYMALAGDRLHECIHDIAQHLPFHVALD